MPADHEAEADGLDRLKRSPRGWYDRGYLPHFDGGVLTQAVTFRLADSLPHGCVARWKEELRCVEPTDAKISLFRRIENCLDKSLGACHLRDPRIGGLVQEALSFFDGKHYVLHAWVVMPNHVHALLTPVEDTRLEKILHSWKSFTAKKANQILRRVGPFWQRESHDRFIRDEAHFLNTWRYIEENPVVAGLCRRREAWRFSSAYGKPETGSSGRE